MAYPEELGINSLMASAAGKTYPLSHWNDYTNTFGTNLKGYRGEDYANIGNRFWEYKAPPNENPLMSLLKSGASQQYNKAAGMTRIPDLSTGTWHTTDPGYAQAFTTDAEVPIIREMDMNLPIEKSTPGVRKNLNQLITEKNAIMLDWKPEYSTMNANEYDKLFTVEDQYIDDYWKTNPVYDEGWGTPNYDKWRANMPTKLVTGLENELRVKSFPSSAKAWPYGTQVPLDESEFLLDYVDEITPEGGDKIWTQMKLEEDAAKMAELKAEYNKSPEIEGKRINQPDLHLTPHKMNVANYSKVNVPLSIQAAVGQHLNQGEGDYLHRGVANTSKLPLNTLGGWKQLAGTTGNIFKAKAHDIYQDWKPRNFTDKLGEVHSNWKWGNNPVTRTLGKGLRFAGGIGDVALGGMAISDVLGGTNMVGSSVRDVNRMMNVPMDRQGNVIQNNRVYNNLQNVAQRDVGNPNEMRGATSFDTTRYNPREMNTGGIVSNVV